jgi:AraC-like DNA-binding protein
MLYRRHVPAPPLSEFVECFWYYNGFFPDHSQERLLPDGAIEILIDLEGPAKKLYGDETGTDFTEYRQAWISGQHSRFLVIGTEQNSSMMGIRFHPGGAHPFLPFPVSELNDGVVPMELVWGAMIRGMREELLEAVTVEDKFRIAERVLRAVRRAELKEDKGCSYAISRLRSAGQGVTVRELSDEIGLSQRQLLRLFRERVGLSPKALGQVFRFQNVLHRLNKELRVHWVEIANDAGYFDQAHFVREFQRFTGLNPSQYLRDKRDYGNYVPIC